MLESLDMQLFELLNMRWRCSLLDTVLPVFSINWLLWALVGVFFVLYAWYARKTYGSALWRIGVLVLLLGASAGIANLSCDLIKESTDRARPYQSVENSYHYTSQGWEVQTELPPPPRVGMSLPSAHAAVSMAIAMVFAVLFPRCNPWILLLPLLVGWSRVYMGKHFPFDVVAGWGVGLAASLLVWLLVWLVLRRLGGGPRPIRPGGGDAKNP